MEGFLVIAFVLVIGYLVWRKNADAWASTPPSPHLVCPHCETKGVVKVRQMTRKKGVSGGKATGAVLTGGVSMLGTGLSRKQRVREMTCTNCDTVWDVE